MDETISGGVIVCQVGKGTPAHASGIRAGDVIVSVNSRPVRRTPPDEIRKRVNELDRLELLVASTATKPEGRVFGTGVFANRSIRRTKSRRMANPVNAAEASGAGPATPRSGPLAPDPSPAEPDSEGGDTPTAKRTSVGSLDEEGMERMEQHLLELQQVRLAARSASQKSRDSTRSGSESDGASVAVPAGVANVQNSSPRLPRESGEYGFDRAGSMGSLPNVVSEEDLQDPFLPGAGAAAGAAAAGSGAASPKRENKSLRDLVREATVVTPPSEDDELLPIHSEPGHARQPVEVVQPRIASALDDGRDSPLAAAPKYIVLELGTTQIRVGGAGEDSPRHVFHAVVGSLAKDGSATDADSGESANTPVDKGDLRRCGSSLLASTPVDLEQLRRIASMSYPLRGGSADEVDFEGLAQLVSAALKEIMTGSSQRHQLLLIDRYREPTRELLLLRQKLAEMLFHSNSQISGILFSDETYLSCLGSDRRCALVVHSGETDTTVLPVIRSEEQLSEPLIYARQQSKHGGRSVTEALAGLLEGGQSDVVSRACGHPPGSEPYMLLVQRIKEELCYVALDYEADERSCRQSSALEMTFSLDSGEGVCLGSERFSCAESIFRKPGRADTVSEPSLPELVVAAIQASPKEHQQELWNNIVLSGGNTQLQGFEARLRQELQVLEPGKTRTSNRLSERFDGSQQEGSERRFLPWSGGSVLATTPFAQERLISRESHTQLTSQTAAVLGSSHQGSSIVGSPYAVDLVNLVSPAYPSSPHQRVRSLSGACSGSRCPSARPVRLAPSPAGKALRAHTPLIRWQARCLSFGHACSCAVPELPHLRPRVTRGPSAYSHRLDTAPKSCMAGCLACVFLTVCLLHLRHPRLCRRDTGP